jgi:hypothetical protein
MDHLPVGAISIISRQRSDMLFRAGGLRFAMCKIGSREALRWAISWRMRTPDIVARGVHERARHRRGRKGSKPQDNTLVP